MTYQLKLKNMKYLTIVAFVIVPVSIVCIFSFRLAIFSDNTDCPSKFFYLTGMKSCHEWLNCAHLDSIHVKELIGLGAVKAVYKATWKGFSLAYSKLNNPDYIDDFRHGLKMLQLLQHNKYIVQLIGFCESENVILTQYYKNGNAINVTNMFPLLDINSRLNLCLNYALILEFLHNSPIGTRVMCDSNDLPKVLSQFVVSDNFKLLLNDVDALPEVNKKRNQTIKCGHREITGTFVAPEQLWHNSYPFNNAHLPGYDEKTDIWKAASVCDYFLGNVLGSDVARYHLFSIHKRCKNSNPEKRPTASELVKKYRKTLQEISNDDL